MSLALHSVLDRLNNVWMLITICSSAFNTVMQISLSLNLWILVLGSPSVSGFWTSQLTDPIWLELDIVSCTLILNTGVPQAYVLSSFSLLPAQVQRQLDL